MVMNREPKGPLQSRPLVIFVGSFLLAALIALLAPTREPEGDLGMPIWNVDAAGGLAGQMAAVVMRTTGNPVVVDGTTSESSPDDRRRSIGNTSPLRRRAPRVQRAATARDLGP